MDPVIVIWLCVIYFFYKKNRKIVKKKRKQEMKNKEINKKIGGPWTRSMKRVHEPGPKRGSMDQGSMFCPLPRKRVEYPASFAGCRPLLKTLYKNVNLFQSVFQSEVLYKFQILFCFLIFSCCLQHHSSVH